MVIPLFPPAVGGAENQASLLARQLGHMGVEVTVLTRKLEDTQIEESIGPNSRVLRLPAVSSGQFLWRLMRYLGRRANGCDVLHFHTLDSPLLAALVPRLLHRRPVVAKVTRSGPCGPIDVLAGGRGLRRLRWLLLRRSVDRFVAVNEESRSELESAGVDWSRIASIPNGVDVSATTSPSENRVGLRRELRLPPDAFIGTCVGRLIPRKRFEWAVEAWKQLVSEDPRPRVLLILGDGPERGRLESKAATLRDRGLVRFMGQVSRETVIKLLSGSDCFVLPSESEGLSNALLEAMAAGAVPVVTRIRANLGIVSDRENGIVFDRRGELAPALAWLEDHPESLSRLSKQARETINSRFSIDCVGARYLQLYQSLMTGLETRQRSS